MVLGRKEISYKLSRTSGRVTSNQDLYKGQSLCTRKAVNGRCSGNSIHKQHTHSEVLSNLALDLWELCIHNKMEV